MARSSPRQPDAANYPQDRRRRPSSPLRPAVHFRPDLALVNDLDIVLKSVNIRHAPIPPILFKLVQVAVSPTRHGLNCVVEGGQKQCARDLDAPPDWRFDVEESDLQ